MIVFVYILKIILCNITNEIEVLTDLKKIKNTIFYEPNHSHFSSYLKVNTACILLSDYCIFIFHSPNI